MSDQFQLWHESEEGTSRPDIYHSRLDYHARAYERAEHYLRNAIFILAQESDYFGNCRGCFADLLKSLPDYLKFNIDQFAEKMQDCPVEYRWNPTREEIDPCRYFV